MSYVDLTTFKAWAGITVDKDDAAITAALAAACGQVDAIANRTFGLPIEPEARTFTVSNDGRTIMVDDVGSADILIEGDPAYVTLPANALARGLPITRLVGTWTQSSVTITARYGWPFVPAEIEYAVCLQANRLRSRPKTPEGISGFGAEGAGAMRLTNRDADVLNLVLPFRREAIA